MSKTILKSERAPVILKKVWFAMSCLSQCIFNCWFQMTNYFFGMSIFQVGSRMCLRVGSILSKMSITQKPIWFIVTSIFVTENPLANKRNNTVMIESFFVLKSSHLFRSFPLFCPCFFLGISCFKPIKKVIKNRKTLFLKNRDCH